MDKKIALKYVSETGRMLLKAGLVARTWGNISARISDNRCAITPSGMGYDNMTPEDIVELDIYSGKWSGDKKPSGERGVHTAAYRIFPEDKFVIHTHQNAATAIGLTGIDDIDITADELYQLGGLEVASYGLPSSDELINNVSKALKTSAHTILMAHHGVLISAESREQAMERAALLESICLRNLKGQDMQSQLSFVNVSAGVYNAHSTAIDECANNHEVIRAQIDDMAMMIGRNVPVFDRMPSESDIPQESVILVSGQGAYIYDTDPADAEVMAILVNKAAMAHLHTAACNVTALLDTADVDYMHKDYVERYSKLQ